MNRSKLGADPALTQVFYDQTWYDFFLTGVKIKKLGFLGKIFQTQRWLTQSDPSQTAEKITGPERKSILLCIYKLQFCFLYFKSIYFYHIIIIFQQRLKWMQTITLPCLVFIPSCWQDWFDQINGWQTGYSDLWILILCLCVSKMKVRSLAIGWIKTKFKLLSQEYKKISTYLTKSMTVYLCYFFML